MIARRISVLALAIVVVVVAVILLDSGGNSYVVKMRLADANGLRQGSPVAIGGQDVGTISMSVKDDHVIVSMKLNRAQAPVGRNATAEVASVNLLGQKRVELDKGNLRDPAPSGYTLSPGQVTVTPDLDQVIDVLTPDVRARLAILINEAGEAFTGRKEDFSTTLQQLPADLQAGDRLVSGVSDDNHTLAQLVEHSDAFVSQLAQQRAQLVHLVGTLGQASATVQAKRAQLAAILEKAPGTLATLQTFLVKLQNTTVPLGPAAVDITDTAPALDQTLGQLDPFRKAADPTLRTATRVAPELTRLATGATPIIRQATPVVSSLASFSSDLKPISAILGGSADNLVAILQNWSEAIEFRDGLSHVFRGEASITPQIVESMVNQLEQAGTIPALERSAKALRGLERSSPSSDASKRAVPSPSSTGKPSSSTTGTGSRTTTGTTTTTSSGSGTTASTTTPSASPGSGASVLGNLLSFLLNP